SMLNGPGTTVIVRVRPSARSSPRSRAGQRATVAWRVWGVSEGPIGPKPALLDEDPTPRARRVLQLTDHQCAGRKRISGDEPGEPGGVQAAERPVPVGVDVGEAPRPDRQIQ